VSKEEPNLAVDTSFFTSATQGWNEAEGPVGQVTSRIKKRSENWLFQVPSGKRKNRGITKKEM